MICEQNQGKKITFIKYFYCTHFQSSSNFVKFVLMAFRNDKNQNPSVMHVYFLLANKSN